MRNWYCIFTKRGQEDIVSKKLGALAQVEVVNPKIKVRRFTGFVVKEMVEGLFPSYIFSKLDLARYLHMVKYTRGVRRFVGDRAGNPHVVDDSIVELITSRIKNGFIQLERPQLASGDQVIIKKGPFSGLEGLFIEETKASERVVILLNTIQYQARMELPRECVACPRDGLDARIF